MADHVLTATDGALKAYFEGAAITGLDSSNIVSNKESAGKEFPVLICASESAARKRSKNWLVTGSILLKSDPTTDANADNLTATSDMERSVIEALETNIPRDDRPQPLADAIQAAAIAAAAVVTDEYLMTAFTVNSVTAGFDEAEIWTFSVDFSATVIA